MDDGYAKIYNTRRLAAKVLVDFAKQKFYDGSKSPTDKGVNRFTLVYDLYVKVASYAAVNKVFFCLAFVFGFGVLLWPSLAIIAKDFDFEKSFLNNAIVQTTITGMAALSFAVYSHYKKRQIRTENLMRLAVYSDMDDKELIDKVVTEMAKLDLGFSFSAAILNKEKPGENKDQP